MNKKTLLLALSVLTGIAFSCTQTVETDDAAQEYQTKILNTPYDCDDNSILICMADSRSPSADSIPGIKEYHRVFDPWPGREEEEHRFGLDRWFIAELEDGAVLTETAQRLAKDKSVAHVQYNSLLRKISDGITMAYSPRVNTKAGSAYPWNDPYIGSQWHILNTGSPVDGISEEDNFSVAGADVNVTEAWKLTAGDPSIIVAVVDEGVAYTHPDLKANMWTNEAEIRNGKDDDNNGYVDDFHGYNFAENGPITWDQAGDGVLVSGDTGHGTHVAGIIAATSNNGEGISGIAGGTGSGDGVRIMSCQIFSGSYSADISDFARAIRYAANMGASILQCSFGVTSGSYTSDNGYAAENQLECLAYNYFMNSQRDNPINGGIAIFAAGNNGKGMSSYPGASEENISVTAIAADYRPTYYTNYGPGCNIAAPGGEFYTGGVLNGGSAILSTVPLELEFDDYETKSSGYGYKQGTSMACPAVSGVAALGLSYMKKLGKTCTPQEFKAMLLSSVNDVDTYCTGTKKTWNEEIKGLGDFNIKKFQYNMGTGNIDAWRLLMQIEGTPCLTATVGEENDLSLRNFFGDSYKTMTFTEVEISDADMEAAGLKEKPEVRNGYLVVRPHKSGNFRLNIKAIAGGDKIGGEENIGGMEISKTVSVVARGVSGNNGGWL